MDNERESPPRVVVAGLGAVSAFGGGVATLWQGISAGRVAIRPVERIPMDGFRTRIAGEVPLSLKPSHGRTLAGGSEDRIFDFACDATEEAIGQSGLSFDSVPASRWGVSMASMYGAYWSVRRWYIDSVLGDRRIPGSLRRASPQQFAETVAGAFGFGGPVISVNNSCAAGTTAIGIAMDLIQAGQADVMVAGGAEVISDFCFGIFSSLQALSPEPATPYSAGRKGLSSGEGSGVLLLVREDLAVACGLPILCELLGYGLSLDGYDAASPEPKGEGISRCIRAALTHAGIAPEDVDYINGHGTGTPNNDPAETAGIRSALGRHAYQVPVSSTKSMTGHLMGGAGGIESVITIQALQAQIAPPTAGYRGRDPACDLDYVPNVARSTPIDVALNNNFAFGGSNATAAFGRYNPDRLPPPPAADRVVVTGISVLSPFGHDLSAVWEAAQDPAPACQDERVRRLELDLDSFLSPRGRRRMDLTGVLSVISAQRALADAGLEITNGNGDRVGVMLGLGIGTPEATESFIGPLLQHGPRAANPVHAPNIVHNAAVGQVAMRVGVHGPAGALTSGHTAGAAAICSAYNLVSTCRADAMICLALNTIPASLARAYEDVGLLGPDTGFRLAEVAVALILESLSHARSRGARVLGEIRGYGMSCDTHDDGSIDPYGSGLQRAMRLALGVSRVDPSAIGTVWAGASHHRPADVAERWAIRKVFGRRANVLAPKMALGEPIGAGGPLTLGLAMESWRRQDGIPGPALINSPSLGGSYTSIVAGPVQSAG